METAIDKLKDLIYSYGKLNGLGNEHIDISTMSLDYIIEQCKKLEKQQIVNAYFGGYLNGESKMEIKSEEYYVENFSKR
jgi:hypothetical protein